LRLTDSEGHDAVAAALLRGHEAIATLLHDVATGVSVHGAGNGDQASSSPPGEAALEREPSVDTNKAVVVHVAAGPSIDEHTIGELLSSISDEEGVFDLSGWCEEIETPSPGDDPTCADDARTVQALLSRHVPIDTDVSWDDVEIDLPQLDDLARRRFQLTGGLAFLRRAREIQRAGN
jgi:RNA polymerase primary sigma factor